MRAVRLEEGDDGSSRVVIDSAALAQAVYVYRPILASDGCTVTDLLIESMNAAARNVPLSDAVVVGRLASEVFIDMEAALLAATAAWAGRAASPYGIQRRGIVEGQSVVVQYEVSTFRAAERIVQVSIDHTVVHQLENADDRFRKMAEESTEGLILLSEGSEPGRYVPTYANRVATRALPALRLGQALTGDIDALVASLVAQLVNEGLPRAVVRHGVLARETQSAIILLRLSGDQVLLVLRELLEEESARREVERADQVLDAVAAGSFGAIHVLEPITEGGRLVAVGHLWGSAGIAADDEVTLELDDVLAPARLLQLVTELHETHDARRHGWTRVAAAGRDRNLEYVLVRAGDRFVLEYVERTTELEARAALAEVSAAVEVQRVFLSRISHELRSPLHVIHGYGQLLRMGDLPPDAATHLSRIEDGVERMVRIVDDLIALGQLDHGLVRFERRTTALGEVLRLVDGLLEAESTAMRSAVRVVRGSAAEAATVETDPDRFAEVIRLVLDGTGGVDMLCEPFVRGASHGIRISVEASSAGVDRIWDDAIDGRVMPGPGLRLAVARELSRLLDIRWERRVLDDVERVAMVLLAPVTPVNDDRP